MRDLDGTIRENRAEDDVIDRAIDFARQYGIRMIWLDKECLPREGEDDGEVGLQAMGIVYNRTVLTAGLHDTVIMSGMQLAAIKSLEESFRKHTLSTPWQPPRTILLAAAIPIVLDFIASVNAGR